MDFEAIKKAAQGYQADMSRFLRDMISHPSESCEEKEVVMCIKAEMEKLGYDKVEIDGLGNVIGWMGQGEKIIAIDSHIDTVGIGNINNWEADPYKGYETDDIIYGRGGSDQEGGMASAVYGAKIMKDLGLIPAGYKIMVVGSVQEEDCDGMCWQYIVNKYFPSKEEAQKQIEFVISTEPTDGGIYRGHRGRMEIRVDVKGVSCHGSAPGQAREPKGRAEGRRGDGQRQGNAHQHRHHNAHPEGLEDSQVFNELAEGIGSGGNGGGDQGGQPDPHAHGDRRGDQDVNLGLLGHQLAALGGHDGDEQHGQRPAGPAQLVRRPAHSGEGEQHHGVGLQRVADGHGHGRAGHLESELADIDQELGGELLAQSLDDSADEQRAEQALGHGPQGVDAVALGRDDNVLPP